VRKINSVTSTYLDNNSIYFNSLLRISAFPKDGKNWRLDWFGEIAFPNRLIRRTQPSVLVHLSRVIDDRFHNAPSILLSPDATTPAKFQRKVWISVGTMPMLRVGDIWCNGELVARPEYEIEYFSNLHVDRSTAHLVKSGLNLDERGFLLPLAEHPWHMHCTQSYSVMLDLPNNRRLIIPCLELIRFYFGSSSRFLTQLFLPPIERSGFYTNPTFDKLRKHLTFDLADKMSGSSAADIGRLHLDPIAWHAATLIGTSALSASVSRLAVYPQTHFPFEGSTNLSVNGKWLSFEGQAKSTFLVYSLRSCSHPFPFKSLSYYMSSDSMLKIKNREMEQADTSSKSIKCAAQDSPNQQVVEQDSSNRLTPKTVKISDLPRFPDLLKKQIWKNKIFAKPDHDAKPLYVATPSVDNAAIGSPGSEKRIRPIDLSIVFGSQAQRHRPVPDFMKDAVEQISKLTEFNVELLTESEEDGWTVPITILSNDDGEIDPRLFFDDELSRLNLRRIAVFTIKQAQEQVSLVMIESFQQYFKLYSTTGQNDDEVFSTMRCAAGDFLHRPETTENNIVELINWVFEGD
jgi:hypothetical protein